MELFENLHGRHSTPTYQYRWRPAAPVLTFYRQNFAPHTVLMKRRRRRYVVSRGQYYLHTRELIKTSYDPVVESI